MNQKTNDRKIRLDQRLVELGLVPSRQRAQGMILSGNVLVNDEPSTKVGRQIKESDSIRLKEEDHPYVSRGALKLLGALEEFKIEVEGKTVLDIGSSTGGFTDLLLQKGAVRSFCVDVGKNQLDWKIRSDPRVEVKEGMNARKLKKEDIGTEVDLIVVDVSFISLSKILPALVPFFREKTQMVTLIKPQFEVGREKIASGGIVRDEAARQAAVLQVRHAAESLGLSLVGLIESPLKGVQGNQEYLALWEFH